MTYLSNLPLDLKPLLLHYLFNHDLIEACQVLNYINVSEFVKRDFDKNFHKITHPLGQELMHKYMTPFNLYKLCQEYQDRARNANVEKLIENVRSTEDYFDPFMLSLLPDDVRRLINEASTASFSSILVSKMSNEEISKMAKRWLNQQM